MHRDVKPGNLLLSDADVVKLADFGIARATDQSSITQVGSVLGTAAYLSPEQARGEEAGPSADIYSLGVVSYQLLSGRLPYEATSLSELALKQQRELPQSLVGLNPHVPVALSDAVALSISIDPTQRPAGALELSELIRDGAQGISPIGGAADAASDEWRRDAAAPGARGADRGDSRRHREAVQAVRRRRPPPELARSGRPARGDQAPGARSCRLAPR